MTPQNKTQGHGALYYFLPLFGLRRHLLVFRGGLLALVFGLLGRGVVRRRRRRRVPAAVLGLVILVGLVGGVLLRRGGRGLVVVVLLHLAEGGLGVGADAAREEHGLLGEVVLALLGHVVARLDEPLDVAEEGEGERKMK